MASSTAGGGPNPTTRRAILMRRSTDAFAGPFSPMRVGGSATSSYGRVMVGSVEPASWGMAHRRTRTARGGDMLALEFLDASGPTTREPAGDAEDEAAAALAGAG